MGDDRGVELTRRSVLRGGLGAVAGIAVGVGSVPLVAGTATAAPRQLYRGCRGSDVKALQKQMAGVGYWCGAADGDFGELTQQAVWAVQKHNRLTRDAIVGPITRGALAAGSVPRPVGGSGSRVEVHLAAQLLLVVRSGRTRRVLNTSTGSGEIYWLDGRRYRATTPTGSWRVYSTWARGWQPGPLGPMWRPMYYDRGFAVHGSSSIPPWPASHGCSRLSTRAMDMLWSTGYLQLGTRVSVVDA